MYSLKRKSKSKTTGDGPSRTARPLTKIARTYEIMRDKMRPEVEVVSSETPRPSEVTTPYTIHHGKSPMTKTPFISSHSAFTISFTPLQPIPPSSLYIPFGTISTPISEQTSLSVKITTPIPSEILASRSLMSNTMSRSQGCTLSHNKQ